MNTLNEGLNVAIFWEIKINFPLLLHTWDDYFTWIWDRFHYRSSNVKEIMAINICTLRRHVLPIKSPFTLAPNPPTFPQSS